MIGLFNDDCLKIMAAIPSASIDAVICDPPYGTTACKWDTVIPLEPMWEQLKRIIKPNGAIVLFGSEPFSSVLRMSNIKMYRYDWVWDKTRGSNFQLANKQPMKSIENVLLFSKAQTTYNPQFWYSTPYSTSERKRGSIIEGLSAKSSAANICTATTSNDGKRFPLSILKFQRDGNRIHPTQKPVALMEYLIKTYTNEGEIVLDFTMGSGTTGVAAVKLKRNFIGIELNQEYFQIAQGRIKAAEEAK